MSPLIAEIEAFQPLRKLAMEKFLNALKQDKRFLMMGTSNYGRDFVCTVSFYCNKKHYQVQVTPFSNEYQYELTEFSKGTSARPSAWTKHNQFSPNGYELMLEYILEQ